MTASEELMRLALEGQFTYYVGRPEREDNWTSVRKQRQLEQAEREQRRLEAQQEKARKQYEAALTAQQYAQEPDYRLILSAVAVAHSVTIEDILSIRRTYKIKLARHHAAWELRRRKPSFSLSKIGHHLRRDHSTVINSLEFVDANRSNFTAQMETVQQLLSTPNT